MPSTSEPEFFKLKLKKAPKPRDYDCPHNSGHGDTLLVKLQGEGEYQAAFKNAELPNANEQEQYQQEEEKVEEYQHASQEGQYQQEEQQQVEEYQHAAEEEQEQAYDEEPAVQNYEQQEEEEEGDQY